jgi:hypothetical protein
MTLMPLLWSLTLASLCLSTCAVIAAFRTSDRSLLKRLREHSERLDELAQDHETLRLALQRETARNNMRSLRLSRKATEHDAPEDYNGSSPGLDPEAAKDEWTRKTNLALARGDIKPFWRK